jgi:CRISPR-associated protein Cmr6
MARAYAKTVWLSAQTDQEEAGRRIEEVFGWARDKDAHVGAVVFHDAWPQEWPRLIVDIVNSHHKKYYSPPDDKDEYPPGDWEDPEPVYFLAVKRGTTFTFPLSKRRPDVADELLDLARQWLLGALCHLGAGAKTNAGYGAFKPVAKEDVAPPLPSQARATFETTLKLVTPAFLAGANQEEEDCDLRSATLRGHLRWWWRTMHAGFLDVKTLRALEAAIWGDTHGGGAVRIVVEKAERGSPQLYEKRSKSDFNDQLKRSDHGIPGDDPKKTTQGLWYASYGMDEGRGDKQRRRYVLDLPASWHLRLIARPARFLVDRKAVADPKKALNGQGLTAQQVIEQAKAALWLLCHFGGVGSKSRKGFGSLVASELNEWSTPRCRDLAAQARRHLQLPNRFSESLAFSPSLQQMFDPVEATFTWPEVWTVLDQVGFAYQAFAKKHKHRLEKKALGLPRRIGQPVQGTFNPKPPVAPDGRHASPVHIHVERRDSGGWAVRAIAFPATKLPDLSTSRTFLKQFLAHFGDDLKRRANLPVPPSVTSRERFPLRPQPPSPSRVSGLPRSGDRVEAELLPAKTKKGGWKAKHVGTGISGPIHNSADVPSAKKPGDLLTLIVASANEREIAFLYPTSEEERSARQSPDRPRPGRGPRHRRGPR